MSSPMIQHFADGATARKEATKDAIRSLQVASQAAEHVEVIVHNMPGDHRLLSIAAASTSRLINLAISSTEAMT